MSSARVLPVVLGLVVIMATACTNSQAGQARPGAIGQPVETSAGSPSSTSTGARPTVTIPPRPEELTLSGVDPCALYTEAQRRQLNIDRTRQRTNGSQHFKGMLECVLEVSRQRPTYHYSVTAATNEGIGPWLTGTRNVDARLSSVEGFAAATYWIQGANGTNTDGCSTAVDVAANQQLILDTNNDGEHTFTLEQLCQRAEQAAALAVQTLRTLR